jgi:16S rRNA (guanine527-N7)-methyltransferase
MENILFEKYGFNLAKVEEEQFSRFLALFQEYNAHTNLSAIRDEGGIIEKHFIDSLFLEKFLPIQGRILDIGSGGGFP